MPPELKSVKTRPLNGKSGEHQTPPKKAQPSRSKSGEPGTRTPH
jgi:hypothetical protein